MQLHQKLAEAVNIQPLMRDLVKKEADRFQHDLMSANIYGYAVKITNHNGIEIYVTKEKGGKSERTNDGEIHFWSQGLVEFTTKIWDEREKREERNDLLKHAQDTVQTTMIYGLDPSDQEKLHAYYQKLDSPSP